MCDIANKIYLRRKELGLTLEEVGQAVGVGRSTVLRWESGMIKNMGRDKIAALARVLQLDPVELVPGPDDYRPPDTLSREDLERLEALHQDPELGLLFDRTRKMTKEDLKKILAIVDVIKGERDGDD